MPSHINVTHCSLPNRVHWKLIPTFTYRLLNQEYGILCVMPVVYQLQSRALLASSPSLPLTGTALPLGFAGAAKGERTRLGQGFVPPYPYPEILFIMDYLRLFEIFSPGDLKPGKCSGLQWELPCHGMVLTFPKPSRWAQGLLYQLRAGVQCCTGMLCPWWTSS